METQEQYWEREPNRKAIKEIEAQESAEKEYRLTHCRICGSRIDSSSTGIISDEKGIYHEQCLKNDIHAVG